MPISGVVIRLKDASCAELVHGELSELSGFEVGEQLAAAVVGVIDAPDYPLHDAALARIEQAEGVCAVDIVFHDFSDVQDFPRLPKRQRNAR